MKKLFLFSIILLVNKISIAQNVGIGTITPHSSAQLDLTSSNKGFLMPRLTTAQRNAIPAPAKGLMVYDSSRNDYWYYAGAKWKAIGDASYSSDSDLVVGQQSGSISSLSLHNGSSFINNSDSSGYIYDSGGPAGDYGNNENCYCFFTAPDWLNVFAIDLTVVSNNLENPYDTLIVFDNSNRRYVLTGTQTGTYRFFESVGIQFKSNFANTAPGFVIRWNKVYSKKTSSNYDSTQLSGWYYNPFKQYIRGGVNIANNWSPDSSGILSFSYGAGQAKGTRSFAFGNRASASEINTVAMGESSTASGNSAITLGSNNKATGDYSLALGSNTNATELRTVCIGSLSTASGPSSTSIGSYNTSSGASAIAMGQSSTAEGTYSMALGSFSQALATYSTTLGDNNKATGFGSTALGFTNVSKSFGGFVAGLYNDTTNAADGNSVNPLNRIFQIGNGTGNLVKTNAVTVLQNGNVGIGELNPAVPLNFSSVAGNKISLFGIGANHFGLGTQAGLLQIYASASSDDIAFGYGNSNSFTESMRVKGTGDALLKGNLTVQNGKGLIRTISGTQEKKLSAGVAVTGLFAAGETRIFGVVWPESFSAAPEAYVGNVVSGSGGWAEVVMTIAGAGTTGATLYVYNPRTTSVTPNFTVKVIGIGAQ